LHVSLLSEMTSAMAMMGSLTRESISSSGGQFVVTICKGKGARGHQVIELMAMAMERKSDIQLDGSRIEC
jgi:hypothetical protein